MAKNDELPPMGLPLEEPSSSRYLLGLTAMVVACAALVFAIGYGSIQLSTGPCDELYAEALDGLRAEVEFLKESGATLGVNKVEIQALRASTQVAGDSLEACCEQRKKGAIGEDRFQECKQRATTMAALAAKLVAAHGDPHRGEESDPHDRQPTARHCGRSHRHRQPQRTRRIRGRRSGPAIWFEVRQLTGVPVHPSHPIIGPMKLQCCYLRSLSVISCAGLRREGHR